MGFQLPPVESVLYVGAGYAGAAALESILTTGDTPIIPLTVTSTTMGKYAVRVGLVVAISYAAKMVLGREKAKMVAIGGGSYVLLKAVQEFAPGVIPGMNAYRPMAAYRQLAAPQNAAGPVRQVFGQQVRSLAPASTQSRFKRF